MSDPQTAGFLALLSTLEARAKKKGQKSIVKDVLRTLSAAGVNGELVAEISALLPAKKPDAKVAAKLKASPTAGAKAKAKPKTGLKKVALKKDTLKKAGKPAETALSV